MELRRLTSDGLAGFAAYLTNLKAEPTLRPPGHLLAAASASEAMPGNFEVQNRIFRTRLEVAKFLDQLLSPASIPQVERDAGLWAWLALFYFDQLCPLGRAGARRPGEHARYIPQIDSSRRYYRHMLLGPFVMLRAHKDKPDRLLALLSNPPSVATSETYRLFIENPTLIACRAVVDTATWLYFDFDREKIKRGAGSKDAGGCRRLIDFLQQIDCTFDLPVLNQDRLRSLLPEEFSKFWPRQSRLPGMNS